MRDFTPRTLAEIVGQPSVRLLRQFCAAPYPSCWLLEGKGGIGKTAAAYATATALRAVDPWTGLHEIKAVDLNIDAARELFGHTLRFTGTDWRVLILEELEACASVQVQRFLKVALDTDLPPRCIVLATSNTLGGLDGALLQRFTILNFECDEAFAEACQDRLVWIWRQEYGLAVMPEEWRSWGWYTDGSFSMRVAQRELLRQMRRVA